MHRKKNCIDCKIKSRNEKGRDSNYRHFDEELYKNRSKTELGNAWMVALKTLLVIYDKKSQTWLA